MRIFICNRTIDLNQSEVTISNLLDSSEHSIAIEREKEHSETWQDKVTKKLEEVDFVIFLIGEDTFESKAIKWELEESIRLKKRIVGLKLKKSNDSNIHLFEGFHIFESHNQCYQYLKKTFSEDRHLLIEQYKMMVGSTEKVTEQRLKVNNLFFTVTSAILSASLVLGKTLSFSLIATLVMFVLTLLAFITSFFWEKLIKSYGKLNEGKFHVINRIENQLGTDMFQYEWSILKEKIKYESNTETEAKIIKNFRVFIILLGLSEILYALYQTGLISYIICLFKGVGI